MPLTDEDFSSIRTLVGSMLSDVGQTFLTAKVLKRDTTRRLVWVAELGDQCIPLVDFIDDINYYVPNGTFDSWHAVGAAGEPAFQNSWQSFGAPFEAPAFRFDPFGQIELKGLIKKVSVAAPAVNEIMFTLPTNYRPANQRGFGTAAGDNTSNVHGRVDVDSSGNVRWVTGAATNAGSFQFLDDIRFEPSSATQIVPLARKLTSNSIGVPDVGDVILIAFERGTRRLPRCLGVINSLDYVNEILPPQGSDGSSGGGAHIGVGGS